MFKPIENGTSIEIQGLTCHLPPVGYVKNILTGKVEPRRIIKRHGDPNRQFWQREGLPDWYKSRMAMVKKQREKDPSFHDPKCAEYEMQEWDRRLNGAWFMNAGKPVYLSPLHYFYLTWWKIDIGYPHFWGADLEYFYFQQYCLEDPECMGMLFVTQRRAGKCFGKDTPIRMYDGSIKMVQDVVVGDVVMGDDFTPRNVLSLATGREMMYKVTTDTGLSFTCNGSHILVGTKALRTKDSYGDRKKVVEMLEYTATIEEFLRYSNGFQRRHHQIIKGTKWNNYNGGYEEAPIDDDVKFTVKSTNTGNYYGFTVDGNHRFLLENNIVVHNSYKSGVFSFEYVSRSKESNAGIQSKTAMDAKKLFSKTIVRPFKALPSFFKPEYDTAQGITPKTEIRFQQTNARGKKMSEASDKDELQSLIDFQSSDVFAYDGQKLHTYVADEAGKTVGVNVYDRHEVIRYCLLNADGTVLGKALYTTTVEKSDTERTGVARAFKQLWMDSDQTNKGVNGRTISGLYRFFIPATKYKYMNKFGYADEEKGLARILADRESVSSNPQALEARIRKDPLTIEEAFRQDAENCMFNSTKIQDQLDYLQWADNSILERGNFIWKGGVKDGKVVWEANKDGRWEILKGFKLPEEQTNAYEKIGSHFRPLNGWRFASGVDPYDHDKTEDNYKRSMAASLVKQKNNPYDADDVFTNTYVCKYLARPKTAALMYEDMIKQCMYFGTPILVENNKPGIMRYFENRGYERFLVKLKNYKDKGIPSTQSNKQTACEFVESEVESNCSKLFFRELLEDLLEFDITETRKYDLAMAMMWTEVAAANNVYQNAERKLIEVRDIFRKYA